MGPKELHSTVLSKEEEALIVAFRKHTLLPLDDCLYALQATLPHLTRSSLHRCFRRHGISRLPGTEGDKPAKRKFKSYPIGYFHLDIAEVRTEEGRLYLFVAIDRTSKFAYAELHEKANRRTATDFLMARPYVRHALRCKRDRAQADQAEPSLDQWPGRTNEPDPQGGNHSTIPLWHARSTQSSSTLS